MRLIGWLLVILMGLGWLASEVPLPGSRPDGQPQTGWRRTCDGWERITWWTAQPETRRPVLHPTVVALLEMFLALAALVAFSRAPDRRAGTKPKTACPEQVRRSSRSGPYRFVEAKKRVRAEDVSAGWGLHGRKDPVPR